MQYSQIEIENFKMKLQQGQTLDDLADLVNYVIEVQNQKEGTNYKPVSPKRLKHYYANINNKYVNFAIPKKTGGTRTITAPDKFLKHIQRRINLLLTLFFEPKSAAHGFLENRSIVTNAQIHVGKKYVLNVDLKDFFPSIHFGRIKSVLQLPILKDRTSYSQKRFTFTDSNNSKAIIEFKNGNVEIVINENVFDEENSTAILEIIKSWWLVSYTDLRKFISDNGGKLKITDLNYFGLKSEFAQIISNFCCFESKLPQGAPTSPIITNIISQRLDYKLVKLAKEYHCFYTRYADDITFSCDKNRFKDEFKAKLNEIIISEGFLLNEKKSRIQNTTIRQEVTGITVNEKLNLQRTYVRKLRATLHNWEKHGYEKANAKFASLYPLEKGFLKNKTIPQMESVLNGKILFLGMVRGKEDAMYLNYKGKLEKLLNSK